MLQDAHIHIQDIKSTQGVRSFINESFASGFGRFFNCAITPADWPLIKSYAEEDPRVVPFFGFHPWFVDLADAASFTKLAEYLAWPPSFAGEMGLDRARKNVDFELQKEVFIRQLVLAKQFEKPFAVHCVRAWKETIALIKQHAGGLRFLMHSFNGSKEIAQEIGTLGGYFSVPVRQFLRPDDQFKNIFGALAMDRILIETDFPYQVKWTNNKNYLSEVRLGYQIAAEWKSLPFEQFTEKVYQNGTVFTNRASARTE